jgi:hypothetical protein
MALLRRSIGVPRLGFLKLGLELRLSAHGEPLSDGLTPAGAASGSGRLIGVR